MLLLDTSCLLLALNLMPQLDKYIFFNHVVSLTFFFALIYIFVRKSVVPNISTTLKYRKKRLALFNSQLAGYDKVLNFSKTIFDKKGKTFVTQISDILVKLVEFYNKKSAAQLLNIYNGNFSIIKSNNLIADFLYKSKKESKRLTTIN